MNIRKENILFIFMSVVLFTAPFFPGRGSFGFYSVEWSFFLFSAFLMYFALIHLTISRPALKRFGNCSYYFGALLLLMSFSVTDAPNKFSAALKTGQYLPYIFLSLLSVHLVDREDKLENTYRHMLSLSTFFSVFVIASGMYFNNRGQLNLFLLNTVNIETTKVLSYFLFPLAIAIQELIHSKFSMVLTLKISLLIGAVIIAGSRGGLGALVLLVLFSLISDTTKKFTRKAIFVMVVAFAGAIFLYAGEFSAQRYYKQLSGEAEASSFSRYYTAIVAFRVMLNHPFNGIGEGNLSRATETALSESRHIPYSIVNFWKSRGVIFETTATPLKLGAELGVLGCAFYFLFYHYLWRRIGSVRSVALASRTKYVYNGLKLGLLVSFIHNFLDLAFTNYYTWLYYGLIIATANIYVKRQGHDAKPIVPHP